MKLKLTYLCFICLVFFPILGKAQTGIWLDYYQYRLLTNDKWKLSQRSSIQYNPTDNYLFTATYRPDYAHKIRQHGRVIVGNGFFYYQGRNKNSTMELRPWVGFQRSPSRLARVSLTHYIRFENRFFIANPDRVYEARFRYKISALGDIYQNEGTALSVVLEPEVFISFGAFNEFYYNRFQVTTGVRYQWNPFWQTDLSFIRRSFKADSSIEEDDLNWVIQLKVKRLLLRN